MKSFDRFELTHEEMKNRVFFRCFPFVSVFEVDFFKILKWNVTVYVTNFPLCYYSAC
jgi:hypothetical protein